MNNKHFYLSLAGRNIKKNSKFYVPYLLTFVATVAMFYMIHAISVNKHLPGGGSMVQMMGFGVGIISIFSVVFLFYTNSFLIKRRKKEFGLYHILGMEKKHIAKVLFCENLIVSGIGIIVGCGMGVLFQKLIMMLLLRIAKWESSIPFEISQESLIKAVILFAGIFLLTFINNVIQLAKTKTVDLLQGEHFGEREPKTKWFMALLGIAGMGIGYYIALTVDNPLDALASFFIAVLLVIAGTYFLFIAGSIVILKLLRSNRTFYYKTNHFTSVSGMLYRMKQNAAGLATICILSTMVLVTVSTTVCLYVGVEDAIRTRYPYDLGLTRRAVPADFDSSSLEQEAKQRIEKNCEITNCVDYKALTFAVHFQDGSFDYLGSHNYLSGGADHGIMVFTAEEYEKVTGETANLKENEIYVYDTGEKMPKKPHIFSEQYVVKKYIKKFSSVEMGTSIISNVHYIVVADDKVMENIYEQQKAVYKDNASDIDYYLDIDVKGGDEQQIQAAKELRKLEHVEVEGRAENRKDFSAFYGGFLFLGLFLGIVFIIAATLIIYYKQISEGYDDKTRFEIMQKVGMSKREVKASIKSQVLLVFFLPLIVAVIHVCVAFPMVKKLLGVLNLSNTDPFFWCLLGTVAVFAILYVAVYSVTSSVIPPSPL